MNARILVMLSSVIEAATGIALIIVPALVGRLLLGVELPASGLAVARLAGFALLALAIACLPRGNAASTASVRALFAYNLLAACYLGYLRMDGDFASYLLWPACALHAVIAILLLRSFFSHSERRREA